ncbi:hypothetical protein NLU13_8779 [Sarocladium strictum]|uniref:FAD-binding domain-containing protein n=1 Tax=Sarocladium strictum TaxID=5046 RepID=A0AA39L3K1_SARSR|nr:hypothetical protein NLU13_8779 [Sarocladium strictum]
MSSRPKRVAVVGAGVTGLLVAQGLMMNGFEVTVYEKQDSLDRLEPRPISFMVHWGFEIIKTLIPSELWAQIHTTFCNPNASTEAIEGITFFNGHNGEVLFRSPPGVINRLLRHKFRKLLSTGVHICWNQEVGSVKADDDGVIITFDNGSTTTADVVVGADGPRSRMREILLGEDKARCVQSDFVCGYTSTVLGREKAELALQAHPAWTMAYSEMGVCALGVDDAKDPDDTSTWTFNITRIWRGESPKIEGDEAVRIIKENTAAFCEPFKSAAEALSHGSSAFVRSLTYWRTIPWPNHGGRITLAGDAAHAMLPFRGQGVNHAIDDASKLVATLVKVSKGDEGLMPAMDAYGAEVVERCAEAVDTAINEGKLVQNMDKHMDMVVAKRGVSK